MADEAIAQGRAVGLEAGRLHLDLHARHVDAGRALGAARLARHAELHRLRHALARHRVGAELLGEGEAQHVGAASRRVLLVAGGAVGGAHHAPRQLAAGAVIVAHLDRAGEPLGPAGEGRPVERRLERLDRIIRLVPEQAAVVEAGRVDDLAGVQHAGGIETRLHLAEGAHQPLAVHGGVELGADDAVAVLARVRALEGLHQREGLLGDGAHRPHVLLQLEVEHRAHVQAALGGVRVPGALRAVLGEHGGELLRVLGEVGQGHRAILDEGHGFARVLHGHHDVEAGRAQVGDRALQLGVEHVHHAAPLGARPVPAEAERAHGVAEVAQAAAVAGVVLGELDEQQRFRLAAHEGIQRRLEHRDVAGEPQHGGVDQLHGDGLEGHEVLRRVHRGEERAEVADAEPAPAEQGPQLEVDRGGEGERALRADQQVRHVDRAVAVALAAILPDTRRHQRVEVVAADAALHGGEARVHLVRFAGADPQQVGEEGAARVVAGHVGEVRALPREAGRRAVGEHRVDGEDVVAHRPVAQRAPAAGVVAGHAADRGAAGGRHVDREPQAVLLQLAVEVVEHQPRLDPAGAGVHVEVQDPVEVLGAVDDETFVDGLAGLRGAAAARGDGDALGAGDADRRGGLRHAARRHRAGRHHLVGGGVGGVAPAREGVEQDVAAAGRREATLERCRCGHGGVPRLGAGGDVRPGHGAGKWGQGTGAGTRERGYGRGDALGPSDPRDQT